MLKKIILTLPILLTLSQASPIKPLIQFGFSGGGDELVTIEHDYESDYTIDAGDGFYIEAGMSINDNPYLETQFLIGYKFDSDSADNGSIDWSMVPISALGFFKIPKWKFGGGLTYHLNPELKGDFGGDSINDEFDNALGGIAQIQYEPMPSFAIGVRATFIEYTLKRDNTQTADGSSIGVVATIKFGAERSRFR